MPVAAVPLAQILFVLSMPLLLAMAPAQGVVRTMALRPVSPATTLNAVIEADGRIVSARADGSLIVAGRRDRIAWALLSLGVLPLPAVADGCSYPGGGR